MRAGKPQVHAAEPFINGVQVGADALAHAVALTGDLFFVGNNAGCSPQVDENGAALDSLYDTRDDFALLVTEFFQNGKFFGFADFLDDDLLCGLCRDAAEIFLRFKREDQFAANSRITFDTARVGKENVFFRIKTRKSSLGSLFFAETLGGFGFSSFLLARC